MRKTKRLCLSIDRSAKSIKLSILCWHWLYWNRLIDWINGIQIRNCIMWDGAWRTEWKYNASAQVPRVEIASSLTNFLNLALPSVRISLKGTVFSLGMELENDCRHWGIGQTCRFLAVSRLYYICIWLNGQYMRDSWLVYANWTVAVAAAPRHMRNAMVLFIPVETGLWKKKIYIYILRSNARARLVGAFFIFFLFFIFNWL